MATLHPHAAQSFHSDERHATMARIRRQANHLAGIVSDLPGAFEQGGDGMDGALARVRGTLMDMLHEREAYHAYLRAALLRGDDPAAFDLALAEYRRVHAALDKYRDAAPPAPDPLTERITAARDFLDALPSLINQATEALNAHATKTKEPQ